MARIGVIIHRSLCQRLFSPEDRARLERVGQVDWTESDAPIPVEPAVEILRDADVAIGSWKSPGPTERLLAQCPKLRLWVHAAGSVKSMFGPHLRRHGLVLASCAPAIAEQVAEFTLGLLIVGLKRTFANAQANRAGAEPKPAGAMSLAAATVGVIGASQVGRRLIDLLRPFSPRVLLFDPYVSDADAAALGATPVRDLVNLCGACDVVTLHTPLLPTTSRLLGREHFSAMRDGAMFINTSRGGCVDEPAMVEQLQTGRIHACLDVTDPEPAAADSPLRRLPNVVLTSHIAGMAEFRIGRQAVDDVEAFLQGRQPKLVVSEDMLDRVA